MRLPCQEKIRKHQSQRKPHQTPEKEKTGNPHAPNKDLKVKPTQTPHTLRKDLKALAINLF
jgi:hypothetical protein